MASLQPYSHQVGGHTTAEGQASSLTDNNGKFYKPIQSEERFEREKAFYQNVFEVKHSSKPTEDISTHDVKLRLQAFVPKYYGSVEVEGKHHLVLEDLCWTYKQPCIMDVKLGFVTWYPWATQKYIDKCKEKDEATTQSTLGFRLCGLQVHDPSAEPTLWKTDRHWGKNLTPETMPEAIKRFVPDGAKVSRQDIFTAILKQLEALHTWFEDQREFLCFAASALFMYDADGADIAGAKVRVCLVDFAHVYPADGAKDDNFSKGLGSLIQHIKPFCSS